MAPIAAAVAAATVADTAHEVYDEDCPENAPVSLVEHAADQARIANLKVRFSYVSFCMLKCYQNTSSITAVYNMFLF